VTSIFTRIINGEIPGRFVYQDDRCVAFLDVRPLARGHVLVVPRAEVDHWHDLDVSLAAHLTSVAHLIARAQAEVLQPARVGLMIAGFEVPHTHMHVVPMESMADLDFVNADHDPNPAELDETRDALAAAIEELS